jgi:hypothetical protein
MARATEWERYKEIDLIGEMYAIAIAVVVAAMEEKVRWSDDENVDGGVFLCYAV